MQGPFEVVAKANGVVVEPSYFDLTTHVFRVAGAASWVIEINGTPAYVDIVTVAAKSK